jgi:serralysin
LPSSTRTNGFSVPSFDVVDSTSTTATLTLGASVYGNMESGSDSDWYKITLVAGQTYDFRILGVGSSPVFDPELYLRGPAGNLLTFNDDAYGSIGFNSQITFTATTSGTYFLDAKSYEGGDFLISAVIDNPILAVLTADEVAWQLTNNFERYAGGDLGLNVASTAFDVSVDRSITYNVMLLTADEAALAAQAFAMWSDVTGIEFVATMAAAQITLDDSDPQITAYASNSTQLDGTITSSQVMVSTGWFAEFGTTLNSYSFETLVHELGHALGLGHGGNYNGTADYGIDNYYLNDSQHLSIMSYMQSANDEFAIGTSGSNTFSAAQFRYVLTPMIADIIAMKTLYGLSTTTRTSNTTYGFNSNTGNAALDAAVTLNDAANHNYVAFTIFDNGGIDTVNMSGFSGAQLINLNEGASSNVLGGKLNMGIAYGTAVENAIGGSGADRIVGNTLANSLIGGVGSDTLLGAGGADTLNGAAGIDVMFGGLGNDRYIIDSLQDQVNEDIGGGISDSVLSSVNFALAADDNIEVLSTTNALATAAISLTGNGISQSVTGNAGANILNGLAGNDTIFGLAGRDFLYGGAGNDVLIGGAGLDVFVFNTAVGISNVDRINDYSVADDGIRLNHGVFTSLAVGSLSAVNFAANLTGLAVRATDRIIYEKDTGKIFYDADGVNGVAGVHFATVTANLTGFGAAEFAII